MNTECPKCHSNQTQSLAMVHMNGQQHVHTNSTAVGVAITGNGIGLGVGGGPTRGIHQTTTSVLASPPAKIKVMDRKWGASFLAALLGGVFLLSVIGEYFVAIGNLLSLVWLVGMVVWFVNRSKMVKNYNSNIWPNEYARWERSWLCLQCGTAFEPMV